MNAECNELIPQMADMNADLDLLIAAARLGYIKLLRHYRLRRDRRVLGLHRLPYHFKGGIKQG